MPKQNPAVLKAEPNGNGRKSGRKAGGRGISTPAVETVHRSVRAGGDTPASSDNFSINTVFQAMGAQHQPAFRFSGSTRTDWQRWREALQPAVLRTLGQMPNEVPLNARTIAEWREGGLVKRRVVFDVEQNLSAAGYIFRPEGAGPFPAILCCHGHGSFGKDAVMGVRTSPEMAESIASCNYDYGLKMAQAGFVTMAIDWRGFGERDDRCKPNQHDIFAGRDICDVHYVRATLMGMTLLGMNVHDGKKALDYLFQQDFVDADRIGVMGLSFGGTMATWMSIADSRIKAANVICYSDRFAEFGLRFANFCGSQITPGLFQLCDVPDLQGLIAPRPLLVEIGSYDDCFLIDAAMSCYREVERIYTAADVPERLVLDLFDGGHRWSGRKSVQFFNDNL
jgi:dienelactone hydrolase